jgi:hypothetical protein
LRHERSQQSADYVAYLGNDAERATARHRTWRTIAIAGAAAIAAVVGFLSVDNWSDDRRQAELQQQQMQHELNMGGLGLGDEILDGDGGASLRITTGEGGDTTLEIADDSTKK